MSLISRQFGSFDKAEDLFYEGQEALSSVSPEQISIYYEWGMSTLVKPSVS